MASEVVVKFDNFSRHAKRIVEAGAELVAETASKIESEVKSAWSDTKIPVRIIDKSGPKGPAAWVAAGSRQRFYPAFLENGTQDQGARPAMTPAAEREWPRFKSAASRIEKKLG